MIIGNMQGSVVTSLTEYNDLKVLKLALHMVDTKALSKLLSDKGYEYEALGVVDQIIFTIDNLEKAVERVRTDETLLKALPPDVKGMTVN